MTELSALLAVSEFWGGDGKDWLAALIVIVLVGLSAFALYHARTFVRRI